jgi:uncharacterized protein (TIGR03083 family)
MADLKELIRTERLALIEFLETLTPDEWATQSLCGAWTVQDVAAHLAVASSMPPAAVMGSFLRTGFQINKANADNARRYARRGTGAIMEQLRTNLANDAKPLGVPAIAPLADCLVHALDIRRPLGKAGTPQSPQAFAAVADWTATLRWPGTTMIGGSARHRVAGVTLVADDVDWSHGSGPEAHGSAETMLLLLHGRGIGPRELTGHGAETVYARLA